jgi:hypothetical protein
MNYGHFGEKSNEKILFMPILFLGLEPSFTPCADRIDYLPLRANCHGGEGKGVAEAKSRLGSRGKKGEARALAFGAPAAPKGECRGADYGHSKNAERTISNLDVLLAHA